MRRLMIAAALLTAGSPLAAEESCASLDSKAVEALFDEWNFALSSLDTSRVVQRYWPDAVLLPTVSNTPRTNAAMIGDYFEHFLAKRPRGHIDTRTIQGGCNVAMDVGTYTFSLMDDKGVTSEIAARYTFIYQYRDGGWKILHHHSSTTPESGSGASPADVHAAAVKPNTVSESAHAARSAPAAAPRRNGKVQQKSPAKSAALESKPVKAPTVKAPTVKAPTVEVPAVEAPVVETRTAMFANLTSSPSPSKFYPREAARRKERGNVNLKVCADDTGAVAGTPEVVKSSGSKLLDEAAQSWALAVKWVPATLNRRRVEGCTQVDVAFEAAA
jgi:uncharacterized protein (TIGR02246 family)